MGYLIVLPLVILLISIRQVEQYERGVRFTLGKFTKMVNPGWRLVFPIFQSMRKVDLRLRAVEVPTQECLTKDNISVGVTAVLFFKVNDASKAVLNIENFYYATSQLAQTTMRNVVGQVPLDDLLSKREQISDKIREIVDSTIKEWGVTVENVELKDILIPDDMKRTIGKQAEAEREKRAVIIKSEGEVIAAENIKKAADFLAGAPGALHLRTLESINDMSSDQSNTVVWMLPIEVLKAVEGLKDLMSKHTKGPPVIAWPTGLSSTKSSDTLLNFALQLPGGMAHLRSSILMPILRRWISRPRICRPGWSVGRAENLQASLQPCLSKHLHWIFWTDLLPRLKQLMR
ncbi:MAG: slipin family protein [Candidatus Gracilibacteria bacterium]